MSRTARIVIRGTAGERPIWELALAGLSQALQGELTFSPIWLDALDASAIPPDADIVCLSMQPDLRRNRPWADLEAAWRGTARHLHDHQLSRGIPVFVVTIVRHLPGEDRGLLGDLRRLNLLAARLSQECGLFVIDIDRVIAHRGTLALAADAWLGSEPARHAAAGAIIDTLLRTGIDHLVEDEAWQAALDHHAQAARDTPEVADFMPLEQSDVSARGQVYVSASTAAKYQSLADLIGDLRARRMSLGAFARKLANKLAAKIAHRIRRH
jgi:hypothetical protein